MPSAVRKACASGLLALATAAPAWAAWGQIDSFSASATTVAPGTEVQFWVSYSLGTSFTQYGGNNLDEPPPEEGWQVWNTNWYYYEAEAITSVMVTLGGQTQTEFPATPAGSTHYGTLGFSMVFDSEGTYTLDASGSWTSWIDNYQSYGEATRTCWYNDPDARDQLFCDSWQYVNYDFSDSYSSEGGLGGASLTITVAAVPEPATLALWACGLAALGARAARRRAG